MDSNLMYRRHIRVNVFHFVCSFHKLSGKPDSAVLSQFYLCLCLVFNEMQGINRLALCLASTVPPEAWLKSSST